MKLKEIISEDMPLHLQSTVGSKSRKYDGNMQDFKADITRTHGVVKKTVDSKTKVTYFLSKNGKVAAKWNGLDNSGIVYFKE